MEYRGKQYSVILTIGGKWKWSAEIEGQYRSGMAVSRPAGVEKAERAIDKALAPKKKRLQRPERKRPPTDAAYNVKAAKTSAPINAAKPIAISMRKNMVIPSDVGVGALVELKQYSCRPKTDHSEIKRDQSLNKGMERGQYCSTHGNASWPCTNTRRRGVRYISARPVTDRAT